MPTNIRRMPHLCIAIALAGAGVVTLAQYGEPPSPGRAGGPPRWTRILKLSDGRTFITDGGLSIDVALAKPAKLPATVAQPATAKVIEGYLAAPLPNTYDLRALGTRVGNPPRYVAPNGVMLHGDYVDYLKAILPPHVQLRMKTMLEPVIILLEGRAVGVVMPLRAANESSREGPGPLGR